MPPIFHALMTKIPLLAGAGILGVSIFGVGAGALGLAFPLGAELAAAGAGIAAALVAFRRRK